MTEEMATVARLTTEEQALLRSHLGSRDTDWVFNFLLLTIVSALILYVPLYLLWHGIDPSGLDRDDKRVLLMGSVATGFALNMWWRWKRLRRESASGRRLKFDQDLEAGIANVLRLEVTRAVEIGEFEDEGTGFFLELKDGRVLCVSGQDLYDYSHFTKLEGGEGDLRDHFPQTIVEYRCAPKSGLRLGIKGKGEPLRPVGFVQTTRQHFERKPDGYIGPYDGEFYEGPIEATLRKFRYKLERFE